MYAPFDAGALGAVISVMLKAPIALMIPFAPNCNADFTVVPLYASSSTLLSFARLYPARKYSVPPNPAS